MNAISFIMLIFAVLGAFDRLIGNKLKLGAEFERGFLILGPVTLSMLGMIVIAPALSVWLEPVFEGFYNLFGIDPSIISASLLANDMGGAALSLQVAKNSEIGSYNAFIVAAMMGTVFSYIIPYSTTVVPKELHKDLFRGFLAGIITIPTGCIVSGLMLKLPMLIILLNLLPLIILSVLISVGLIFFPNVTVNIFKCIGFLVKVLITAGLIIATITSFTGKVLLDYFGSVSEGAIICVNAAITLAGAFPMMFVVTKILEKPMELLSRKIGINAISATYLVSTLVTSTTTFPVMYQMDRRGIILNAAFSVSASYALGAHIAFTSVYDPSYVLPMIVGKVISGLFAIPLAFFLFRKDTEPCEIK